jgi:alpha-tubulin suppressor-like RCC1 family protein
VGQSVERQSRRSSLWAVTLVCAALVLFGLLPSRAQAAGEWSDVSCGGNHTAAIKADGTLWAWGLNGRGQLGLGDTLDRDVPTEVGGAADWVDVSAGMAHTLALKADGTLWAWGENAYGQLGVGDWANRTTPTEVGSDHDWGSVSAGGLHTLAIKQDGTLWAWGWNWDGQLGLGSPGVWRTSPTEVGTATDWKAVSCGEYHTLALKKDGTLWAWGDNGALELGTHSDVATLFPTQVGSANDWTAVSAGGAQTFAFKEHGALWAWGSNLTGQLGIGDAISIEDTPTEVGSAIGWAAVSTRAFHTVALQTDGSLWAWGSNGFGELGLGSTSGSVLEPMQVGNSTGWAAVSCGGNHTAFIKADGGLWACGANGYGQLGLGDTTDRSSPTEIPPPAIYTTTASAGAGGAIHPSGARPVPSGGALEFTITPDFDYIVADVLVDGISQGAMASYELTDVRADHTISASFAPCFFPNPDGWQFPNGADKLTGDDGSVWQRVFGSSCDAKNAYRWKLQGSGGCGIFSGGTCFGFAASSGLLFSRDLCLSEDFGLSSSYVHPWDWGPGQLGYPAARDKDGNTITDAMSKQAREEIEALHITQWSASVSAQLEAHKVRQPPPKWIEALLTALQTGAQLIGIHGVDGGHALLAFDAEYVGDSVFIGVYDCNHPGDPARYVVLDTAAHTWTYNLGWETWGTGRAGDNWITWCSPSVIGKALEAAPDQFYTTLAECYAAGALLAVDAQGRISGSDGVTQRWEIPGIDSGAAIQALPGDASDSDRTLVGPDPGGLTFLLKPDAGSYAARFSRTGSDLYLGMTWSDAPAADGASDKIIVSPSGDALAVTPAATSLARLSLVDDQMPPLELDAGFAPTTPGADRLAVSTDSVATGVAVSINDTSALADAPVWVGWQGGDGVPVDVVAGGRAEVDLTGGAAAGQPTGSTTVTVKIDDNRDGIFERTSTATIGQPPAEPEEPFAPGADVTAPTTAVTGADAGWHRSPVTLALTPSDNPGGSGMSGGSAKTEYRLDAGDWTAGTTVTVLASSDHSGDAAHMLAYRSTDAAGNVEVARSVAVKIDTTAPVGDLVLNSGDAVTTSPEIVVNSAVSDANGVSGMRFSVDGRATWSAWTAYNASAAVTVPAGNGSKTVWGEYEDPAGNVFQSSAAIILAVPTPTTALTLKLSGPKAGAVKLGKSVTAKGVVTPTSLAGSKVTLTAQLKKGAKWVKAKTFQAPISSTGAYSWKYKPAKKGAYRLQGAIAATATHGAAATRWLAFKVK